MQVTEVHADMRGLFHCPDCGEQNGSAGLARHGIDYDGEKVPDNHRYGWCSECGHLVDVHYPDGGVLPANPSYRWETCEECHGDYKHHEGPDACYKCNKGGFWVEIKDIPAPAGATK